MVEIDGSHLEGGGQILRTAIAVSAITGETVHIFNIRKGRHKPGLKPQHLHGIAAAGQICDAEVKGLKMNSTDLIFSPGKIRGGIHTIDTKTAGSLSLILQTLVPLGIYADSTLVLIIKGGTAVPFSPTVAYFMNIFCFILQKHGVSIEVQVRRHGFYPRGGGEIYVKIVPAALTSFAMRDRGDFRKIRVWAFASDHLKTSHVAERMLKAFSSRMQGAESGCFYGSTLSPGCFITACAEYENGILGASSLGRRGKPAEELGSETAHELTQVVDSNAAVDGWMVDQLVPFMALTTYGTSKDSEVRIPSLTRHAQTNIWVVEKFLGVTFSVESGVLRCVKS